MPNHYNKETKDAAIKYYIDHPKLGYRKCAEHLGISSSTLVIWIKEHNNKLSTSDNVTCTNDHTIDKLRSELAEAKDTIEILKKALIILGSGRI
ncbi:MAG: transposase [Clostridiaceae bacterium]